MEVHTGTDNTAGERSAPCVALYPVRNATGTWQFWNLRTRRYMRHSTWVRMRQSELVTQIINKIAEEEKASTKNNDSTNEVVVDKVPATEESGVEIIPTGVENQADTDEAAVEESEVEVEQADNLEVLDTGGLASRRSARIAAGIKPPERFVHASFVEKGC